MSKPIVYLACPYTHSEKAVRMSRYVAANQAAAQLIADGKIVFSPITMTHPLDEILAGYGETLGSDYWLSFDEAFMCACAELVVLKLDGWQESAGIQREIDYFRQRSKPISYIEPS